MIDKEAQIDARQTIGELEIDKSRFDLVMSMIANEDRASDTADAPIQYTITVLGITYEIKRTTSK